MTPSLVLLDPPAAAPAWAPFAGVRPVAELRVAAWPLATRWARALGATVAGVVVPGFEGANDPDGLPVLDGVPPGPCLVARSDAAVAARPLAWPAGARCLTVDGEPVAWRVDPGEVWSPTADGAHPIEGLQLAGAWDVVTALERWLGADCIGLADDGGAGAVPPGAIILGAEAAVVVRSDAVEPGVVFDVRGGPVVVEAGAEVRHGTRLEGPCWVAAGARVLGGLVRGSAIGPMAVVRGEVSTTQFDGYANKAHDGFLGHSVVGRWVNLGAGTTTSNLKNTYGPVRLDVAGRRHETGRQFLGTLFGDHAKTAIGTMLATGTVVGAGAHVVPDGRPPKWVPPLAWDADGARVTEAGFLRLCERVLPRRGVEVTPARRAALAALHARLARA